MRMFTAAWELEETKRLRTFLQTAMGGLETEFVAAEEESHWLLDMIVDHQKLECIEADTKYIAAVYDKDKNVSIELMWSCPFSRAASCRGRALMMNGKHFFSNDLSCNHQYIRRSYALRITNVSMKWELMNEIGCCTLSFTEYPYRCTLCSSHSLADAFCKVLRLK